MKEYFGEWSKVIDFEILQKCLNEVSLEYKNYSVTPIQNKVFRCFKECKYNDLKVVVLGQDPYPQEGIATGLAFGNSKETAITGKFSPSLEVIMESILRNVTIPFPIFDITMEEWAKQGVLLLNSSLTVRVNSPGSHTNIWKPFTSSLLVKLSEINSGIVYVLLGSSAKSFRSYINAKSNYILEDNHPAYYARNHVPMPSEVWDKTNQIVKDNHNLKINYYV